MLLLKFKCHINVEFTFSVQGVKYIHKYVFKGHDRTTMEFGINIDEIKQYLDARYISSHEACWRLLEYKMHTQVPAVMALPVHLPGQHNVIFDADRDVLDMEQRMESSKTQLMGYFEANREYPQAQEVLYVEFPESFVWHKTEKSGSLAKVASA
jgi:hypothetical protein